MTNNNGKTRNQAGMGLIELMIVIAIFLLVMGIATSGMLQLTRNNTADASKVDKTQEVRQFMDQIIGDIHSTGFPNSRLYDPASNPSVNNTAVGLVSVNSSAIQFEGDVDGSGTVSEVYIQLVVPQNGCPCTLQRGTIQKSQVGTGAVPYYTEVDNVMNQNIFRAFDHDGTEEALPVAAANLLQVKSIGITLNVRSSAPDIDGAFSTITMSSSAKINN